MHERIVMATPVDTSAALSNWQIATMGTGPVQTPVPAFFGGQGGSTAVMSTAATLASAVVPLRGVAAGPVVISNVLDYISDLVYGSVSKQATGDWAGRAIAQGMRQGVIEVNTKEMW